MRAVMCEANRKEDRMCGKQMQTRQPLWKTRTTFSSTVLLKGLSQVPGDAMASFWGKKARFLISFLCHRCHKDLHSIPFLEVAQPERNKGISTCLG